MNDIFASAQWLRPTGEIRPDRAQMALFRLEFTLNSPIKEAVLHGLWFT